MADGPPLLRPIPRRPFDINVSSPTPPDDDSAHPSPNPGDIEKLRSLLDPRHAEQTSTNSLSRAQSVMNLTTSTLFGIYSPTTTHGGYLDQDETTTPWGTGAQTPGRRPDLDEPTHALMKERMSMGRRRSTQQSLSQGPPPSQVVVLASLAVRASLLFALGMGYGVLVSRLQTEHHLAPQHIDGLARDAHGYNRAYLAFWGVFGVILGALLPWFDGKWDETFGLDDGERSDEKEASPETDWALVIRGIGAFAGIVFAIRKLPWASTMQVSLTLALVNPFLWYVIDRSKSGFLLSSAVGMTGTAIMMGLKPDIVPAPSNVHAAHHGNSSQGYTHPEALALGGLATQETIETGIWMLSVLFCSCVCFGNIGRRLALSKSAAGRGRWAGTR